MRQGIKLALRVSEKKFGGVEAESGQEIDSLAEVILGTGRSSGQDPSHLSARLTDDNPVVVWVDVEDPVVSGSLWLEVDLELGVLGISGVCLGVGVGLGAVEEGAAVLDVDPTGGVQGVCGLAAGAVLLELGRKVSDLEPHSHVVSDVDLEAGGLERDWVGERRLAERELVSPGFAVGSDQEASEEKNGPLHNTIGSLRIGG